MYINAQTAIWSPTLTLFPYRRDHVERYHQWMSDAEIQAQTASEPLTLEEEYDMQQAWQVDPDKLTFIITENLERKSLTGFTTDGMIGDVNMFLNELDMGGDAEISDTSNVSNSKRASYTGELEIMIAEPDARRKGYGRRALLLFMNYIIRHQAEILKSGTLVQFSVKVGETNMASLALFQSLGFEKFKFSEYFRETELIFPLTIEGQDSRVTAMMNIDERDWVEYQIAR